MDTVFPTTRKLKRMFTNILSIVVIVAMALSGIWVPAKAAFAGDNGKIAFMTNRDSNFEIYVMDSDGANQTNLTNNPAYDGHPSWSPDGSQIVFASERDGNYEIYVMNADGSDPIRLTTSASTDAFPSWSPDGSQIVFTSYDLSLHNYDIWRMNSDGTGAIKLTDNPTEDTEPVWSPDGTKIAFRSDRDGNMEIYYMDPDGNNQTNLTNHADADGEPNWSPDGSKIAFASVRDEFTGAIWVMNADGSEPTRLTDAVYGDGDPAWSPDGTRIVFKGFRHYNDEIYVMNADGTDITRLTNNALPGNTFPEDWMPDWQPISFVANPYIVASEAGNWFWTTDFKPGTLSLYIYESADEGATLLWDGTGEADETGFLVVDYESHGQDLVPGNYLVVSDGDTQKGLVLELITMEVFDTETEIMAGTAPPGRDVWAMAGPQDWQQPMMVKADPDTGAWLADFKTLAEPFDITEEMRPWSYAHIYDEDGDANEAGAPPPPPPPLNPHFTVFPEWEWFDGRDWPDGATVTITVEGKPECTTTKESWGNFFNGSFGVGCNVAVDDIVTFTDGTTTRTHTVRKLAVTEVDKGTDIIRGIADAEAEVYVWPHATGEQQLATADTEGNWQVNFTGIFDLAPGHGGRSQIYDGTGNATAVDWRIPNPRFEVRYDQDSIAGWEWQPNAEVGISVDGNSIGTARTDEWGYFGISVGEMVELVPGNHVEVSDGVSTKAHTVINISITVVDVDADIVSGTAPANERIQAWTCWSDGCANRWETVDGDGHWSANFSIPGDEGGEEQTADLVPGSWVDAGEWDADGDNTAINWYILNPRFEVRPAADSVAGWEWQPNANVDIRVNGDYVATAQTDPGGYFNIIVGETFDLVSGSNVQVSDGVSSKDHIVTSLSITSVNVDTDLVYGTTAPNGRIQAEVCGPNYCVSRWETVDGDGNWSADFSIPGDEPGEEQTFDFVPGNGLDSREWDEDGDNTIAGYYIPNPRFVVFPEWEFFDGHDWPDGATVNISVEGKPQCALTKISWGGFFNGNFPEGCDAEIGDTVTFAHGTTTRIHVVRNLDVTAVNVDDNTIAGIADAGTVVYVWPHDAWFGPLEAIADESSMWQVDLDDAGYDIQQGAAGRSEIRDEVGNATAVDWYVPKPYFQVQLETNNVDGWEWTPNSQVTISINGTEAATVQTDEWGTFRSHFEELEPFVPGMDFLITDGVSTKTLTTAYLEITNVDPDADTVSGLANAGQTFNVWVHGENAPGVPVTADSMGQWTADFSGQWNIVPGNDGAAQIDDDDGDGTWVPWRLPSPTFGVWPIENHVNGWDWTPQTTIQVSRGNCSTSATSDEWGNFHVEFWEACDLQAGDLVTLTDGLTTKEHVVTNLVATGADAALDTISGTAEPGSIVNVWACWDNGCANRHETADENGNWAANFALPGNEPDEQETFDLQPGTRSDANQSDEDGDFTQIHWRVPNPRFDAWYMDGNISAYEWPVGTQLTLEIEDPSTSQSPDYSTTTEVVVAPWEPNETVGEFHLNGAFEIQPGMTLTVSGGPFSKDLVVSNLTVTSIDLDADLITGGTEPNQMMWMYYSSPSGTCCRNFQADDNGVWTVDYSQPGPNGEPVEDIRPGSSGTINAIDEDGDDTSLNWNVPNPNFSARLTENEVHGYEWPLGASVTLTINDPNTPEPVDYTDIQTVVVADWDPNQTFVPFRLWENEFNLEHGMTVNMTDGQTTKSHVVTKLVVTSVDPDTDTVYGTADPGTQVDVGHIYCDEIGCFGFRRVNADENGNWLADFSVPGEDGDEQDIIDIGPGTGSEARQCDEDGECTQFGWFVPNPRFTVFPEWEWFDGMDWPDGATVTINVEGKPDCTTKKESWGYFFNGGFPLGCDVAIGDTVTFTDGETIRTHIVRNLTVSNVNLAEDIVAGTADEGAVVYVWPHATGHQLESIANANGNWQVDFTGVFDLIMGEYGRSEVRDEFGNSTAVDWGVPSPWLIAFPENEAVEGWEWPEGATVYLTIDNAPDLQLQGTAQVTPWGDPRTYIHFEFGDTYDLKVGDVVTLTDGVTERTHVVQPLSVDAVNAADDTIAGTADAGAVVTLWPHGFDQVATVQVTAGADGAWLADFATVGFNLVLGIGGRSEIRDDANNSTAVDWVVPMPGWEQLNVSGFGDPQTAGVSALEVFQGQLYAGASNGSTGGQVWRLDKDGQWLQVNEAGFGDGATNPVIIDLAVFSNRLYAGVGWDGALGQVWRSADGTNWQPVTTDGFGDENNSAITNFAIFKNRIYAGTGGTNGSAQIWRSATGDIDSWKQMAPDGPEFAGNLTGFAVFKSTLYAAVESSSGLPLQVWRSSNGSDWTTVVADGFGNEGNVSAGGFAYFGGYLYLGTRNDDTGAQLWRTKDGIHWYQVIGNGFGDSNNLKIEALVVYDELNLLYAVTYNEAMGLQIWSSANGTSWEQVVANGFGDSGNYSTLWNSAAIEYKGNILIGTWNNAEGGELWKFTP